MQPENIQIIRSMQQQMEAQAAQQAVKQTGSVNELKNMLMHFAQRQQQAGPEEDHPHDSN